MSTQETNRGGAQGAFGMKAWTALAAAPVIMVMAAALMASPADGQTKAKAKKAVTPPPVAAPVEPPAPPPPPAEPLAASVGNYAAFQNDISALQTGALGTADDLERALDRAAGVNRDSLTKGWIAYGALTAAQQPEFVKSIRDTAAHYGRDVMIRGLTLDPGYAQTLKGGEDAARLALTAARADGVRVFEVGERYKEMAYTLQKQRWANQVAPQQPARVQRMKRLSVDAATRNVDATMAPRLEAAVATFTPWTDPRQFGGANFWDTFRTTPTPVAAAPIPAPVTAPILRAHHDRVQTVNRMTTLAALYVLDATKDPAAQADRMLAEGSTSRCLELAQVQFYQCMSAARFRYENAFCLGEHALKDMGSCIKNATAEVSSSPVAALPSPPPEVVTPVTPPAAATKKKKR